MKKEEKEESQISVEDYKKELMREFESTLEKAELNALSKHSLNQRLTTKQAERMKYLFNKYN